MGTLDETSAEAEGGGMDDVDVQQLEADQGSDDVYDRIDGAYLVEVDLFGGHAVDLGLGLGQALKDFCRGVFHMVVEAAGADDGQNIFELMVRMACRSFCSCGKRRAQWTGAVQGDVEFLRS